MMTLLFLQNTNKNIMTKAIGSTNNMEKGAITKANNRLYKARIFNRT